MQRRAWGSASRRSNERGWPFVIWQSEVVYRDFKAAGQDYDPDGVPASGDEFFVDAEQLLTALATLDACARADHHSLAQIELTAQPGGLDLQA